MLTVNTIIDSLVSFIDNGQLVGNWQSVIRLASRPLLCLQLSLALTDYIRGDKRQLNMDDRGTQNSITLVAAVGYFWRQLQTAKVRRRL